MINFTLQSQKDEMIDALKRIISIKSVKSSPQTNMPYGKGVFDALLQMLYLGEQMYFDSVNLFSHMGYVEYGDGDEILAILTHLDVMPAGEGWTVPPFEATVKDGKIYGRGAIDNKGPAVAALFALNALQENCISLNKRVRLMFGCDEESGWSDIAFYKKSGEEIPTMSISPDAEFPIINGEKGLWQFELKKEMCPIEDTGGVVLRDIQGGHRANAVPAHCECFLTTDSNAILKMADIFNEDSPVKIAYKSHADGILFTTEGVSAHGSKPEDGKNAVAYMIAFLNQLPLKRNYISDMVYKLAEQVGLDTDGTCLGIRSDDDVMGSLTMNLGYIKTDGNGIYAGFDFRFPKESDRENIRKAFEAGFEDFTVTTKFEMPVHYVDKDSKLVTGLQRAYQEITGEEAVCKTIGGATYARAFGNSVAFGPLFPGQKGTEHQPDEHIEIDTLIKFADILANAIVILCNEMD
ncbi:MAG: dipeptidase PepV [Christensenellaceae bacterium]|jgi:succinyl-diaminopimelate desuccinylase